MMDDESINLYEEEFCMKLKKMAAVGLAAGMAAQMLTGCGQGSTTETAVTTETAAETTTAGDTGEKVLKVLTVTPHPEVDPSQVVIQQEIEQETGIKIEWTIVPQTAWSEKKGLTLAQTELPDIMLGDAMFIQ